MKYLVIHELIVPFQLQLKFLIHVISQKHLDKFFIQMSISMLLIIFIWKIQELCWRPLYKNAKWNQRKITPKIIQNIPKKKILLKVPPHTMFSPCTKTPPFSRTKKRPMIMHDMFNFLRVDDDSIPNHQNSLRQKFVVNVLSILTRCLTLEWQPN
jgi:hypothetical protein